MPAESPPVMSNAKPQSNQACIDAACTCTAFMEAAVLMEPAVPPRAAAAVQCANCGHVNALEAEALAPAQQPAPEPLCDAASTPSQVPGCAEVTIVIPQEPATTDIAADTCAAVAGAAKPLLATESMPYPEAESPQMPTISEAFSLKVNYTQRVGDDAWAPRRKSYLPGAMPDMVAQLVLAQIEMPPDLDVSFRTMKTRLSITPHPTDFICLEVLLAALPHHMVLEQDDNFPEALDVILGKIQETYSVESADDSTSRRVMHQRSIVAARPHNSGNHLTYIGKYHVLYSILMTGLLDPHRVFNLEPEERDLLYDVAEALFTPDINTIVAESAQVKMSDLLAPPLQIVSAYALLEPSIGFLIVLNGFFIGLRTDAEISSWPEWRWIDLTFTVIFSGESLLKMYRLKFRGFVRGPDSTWNLFDLVIVIMALVDIVLESLPDIKLDTSQFTVLRLVRLARLARLVRIFRMPALKELSLMVKGLFAGIKTLVWAVVLLFFFVYICGILVTTIIGNPESRERRARDDDPPEFEEEMHNLFGFLPSSMLIIFRCLTGDCATSQGKPLIGMLVDAYGWQFAFAYITLTMLVTFGLFNLIMAIYIENTLASARSKENTMEECIQVGRSAKQLLGLFCAAQEAVHKHGILSSEELERALDTSDKSGIDINIAIHRDTYMQVIELRHAQKIMDELEIESDRARLFDVLDADGSQELTSSEFVDGLIRLRGEAQRSDVLASVLGVRAVMDKVRALEFQSRATALDVSGTPRITTNFDSGVPPEVSPCN
eukprot:NODE_540_length_2951_cov_17.177408.p1 GENE.NODE_540_length_2951_cov_17.177408~~NODE_540_length_2951_cov_17.177408.p1  ORF type:complete len:881 (+),score=189.74 NODE_540_length_2951_cov_17.177408:316-2643(+)